MNINFTNKNSNPRGLKEEEEVMYEKLFLLYYDKLLHIAIGYIGNKEDAEGIIQNVFMKMWEKKTEFTKINNPNSYLFIATKNACLDFLKHQKVKNAFSKKYSEDTIAIQHQFIKDEAASTILESELEKRILKAIELLPVKCQKVFVKSRVEGLKHSEISELLGISIKTVDNHISNALQHMKLHLKEFLTLVAFFFNII